MSRCVWAAVALLALGAAIWEIDPRWITEAEGLDVIRQTTVNQNAGYGSQVIAWIGLPVALVTLMVAGGVQTPSDAGMQARGIGRFPRWSSTEFLVLWIGWSLVGALSGPSLVRSFAFTAATASIVIAAKRIANRDTRLLALAIVTAFFLELIFAAIVKYGGIAPLSVRGQRLTLLSLEANQLGRMATMVAFASAYLLTRPFPHWPRGLQQLVLGGTAVLALIVLLLTGSRAGLAATAFAGLVILITYSRASAWLVVVGLITVSVGLVAASGNSQLGTDQMLRVLSADPTEIGTLDGRTKLWPMVLDASRERLVGGHGLGNDTAVLAPRSDEVGFVVEHAHNLILHLVLTTGLVGAILFLAALVAAVISAPRAARPWVWGFAAYILIAGITESLIRNPDVFLLSLVLMMTLAEPVTSSNPPADRTV